MDGMLRKIILPLGVLCAVLVFSGCGTPLIVQKMGLNVGSDSKYATLENRLHRLINEKRAESGAKPLIMNNPLRQLAREHSRQMSSMQCLTHLGANDRTVEMRADLHGISWQVIGENVARNRGFDDGVAQSVTDWMDSPGHRANLLSRRFTQTGIGITVGEDGYTYFTQVFMLPRPE